MKSPVVVGVLVSVSLGACIGGGERVVAESHATVVVFPEAVTRTTEAPGALTTTVVDLEGRTVGVQTWSADAATATWQAAGSQRPRHLQLDRFSPTPELAARTAYEQWVADEERVDQPLEEACTCRRFAWECIQNYVCRQACTQETICYPLEEEVCERIGIGMLSCKDEECVSTGPEVCTESCAFEWECDEVCIDYSCTYVS